MSYVLISGKAYNYDRPVAAGLQLRIILDTRSDIMHFAYESELVPTMWDEVTSKTLCEQEGRVSEWYILTSIQLQHLGEYHNSCAHCVGILAMMELGWTNENRR